MYNKTAERGSHQAMMCDECFALFQTLEDKTMPCSKPECTGTWTWTRFQQLEAHAQGRDNQSPKGFCDACRSEMQGKGDIQQPCRIKGCKNTWTWTKRMQMESKDGKPPRRLCDECFHTLNSLQDRELPCRIKGCTGKISWSRYQQLEWLKSGKKLENPPAWMCNDCHEKSRQMQPVEQPCRMNGCKKTWSYSVYEQLEAIKSAPEGKEPEAPKKMCKDCFDFYSRAKDKECECGNRGCTNKWTWSRAMQLGAHLHGHDQEPRRMCAQCQAKLAELQPVEQPCVEPSCKGTWTYTPEAQLKDALLKRQPERRHCKACQEFVAAHSAETLKCEKCGAEFTWSVQEQLLTSLGAFAKPRFCAQCNSDELAAMPAPQQVITPAPKKAFTLNIPAGGAWNASHITREWPAGFTREALAAVEESAQRIVCIGDDLTAGGADDSEPSWVPMLGEIISRKEGPKTALINAGINECTTALACSRFDRDVRPFAPKLVIFSFAFADTRKVPAELTDERLQSALAALEEQFTAFVRLAESLEEKPQLLCWLPNPIFPQQDGNQALWRSDITPDENAVRFYDATLRATRGWCRKLGVNVVDCKAMFEMVGKKTALGWMGSWNRPNAEGARNIANWLADAISGL